MSAVYVGIEYGDLIVKSVRDERGCRQVITFIWFNFFDNVLKGWIRFDRSHMQGEIIDTVGQPGQGAFRVFDLIAQYNPMNIVPLFE